MSRFFFWLCTVQLRCVTHCAAKILFWEYPTNMTASNFGVWVHSVFNCRDPAFAIILSPDFVFLFVIRYPGSGRGGSALITFRYALTFIGERVDRVRVVIRGND